MTRTHNTDPLSVCRYCFSPFQGREFLTSNKTSFCHEQPFLPSFRRSTRFSSSHRTTPNNQSLPKKLLDWNSSPDLIFILSRYTDRPPFQKGSLLWRVRFWGFVLFDPNILLLFSPVSSIVYPSLRLSTLYSVTPSTLGLVGPSWNLRRKPKLRLTQSCDTPPKIRLFTTLY